MDQPVSIRGKVIGSSELEFIKAIVDIGWSEGRTWISRELCRQWDWRQQNGHLKDQVCRIMLNELSRLGHVELPPRKRENGVTTRRHYVPSLEMPSYSQEPLQGELGDFGPITLKMVRRAPEEKLWNHLVHQYHYMGYRVLVGSHLKYMAFMDQKPVACLAWASSVFRIQARDEFLGWSAAQRSRNIRFVANNSRFLILPWVRIKNLASHLLGLCARTLSRDWEDFYGHPIHVLETFVETARFQGTCYKAANWVRVGTTKGHAKRENRFYFHGNPKDVYVLPVSKNFRQVLAGGAPC
jgi:hypothetical protein